MAARNNQMMGINRHFRAASKVTFVAAIGLLSACSSDGGGAKPPRPDIAPTAPSMAEPLHLDASQIAPMYRKLIAIDLPNVVQVAAARNIDILTAQQRVAAANGQLEASVEGIFPIIGGGAALDDLHGVNRTVTGELIAASFTTFQPAALIQWLINPGRVVFDVIASRKRLAAAEHNERFVVLDKLRQSVVQYYDLVLAQARVSAATKAIAEADELLRLTNSRLRNGTGLVADEARARAAFAARQQDLVTALNDFYAASVALAVTLDLDVTETLVPKPDRIEATPLVRDSLSIDEMLMTATQWRPDLLGTRASAEAASADRNAALWGALSPQLQASYQYGGLSSDVRGQNFPLQEQQHAAAGPQVALSLSTFGRVKTANAVERQAELDVERRLQEVRAQVVRLSQDSAASVKLIEAAQHQVDAAAEAARLSQVNLRAGTMLTLDVLQADDALNDARQRYAAAVVKYNQSQVNLLAALGVLDSVNIAPNAEEKSSDLQ